VCKHTNTAYYENTMNKDKNNVDLQKSITIAFKPKNVVNTLVLYISKYSRHMSV